MLKKCSFSADPAGIQYQSNFRYSKENIDNLRGYFPGSIIFSIFFPAERHFLLSTSNKKSWAFWNNRMVL